MNFARALLATSLTASMVGFMLEACTSPDPSEVKFVDKEPPESRGRTNVNEAGAGGDPVFGNDPFVYEAPTVTANTHGETHDTPVNQKPLQGKNCFIGGCHIDKKPWTFAGTVYRQVGGDAGADGGDAGDGLETVPKAEIRVVGPDGKEVGRTYTDPDGNFWYAGAEIPPGSRAGVRREGGLKPSHMTATISSEAESNRCSTATGECHGNPTHRIIVE